MEVWIILYGSEFYRLLYACDCEGNVQRQLTFVTFVDLLKSKVCQYVELTNKKKKEKKHSAAYPTVIIIAFILKVGINRHALEIEN